MSEIALWIYWSGYIICLAGTLWMKKRMDGEVQVKVLLGAMCLSGFSWLSLLVGICVIAYVESDEWKFWNKKVF